MLVTMVTWSAAQGQASLSESDRVAIQAANLAYPAAWLTGEPDRVLATLTEDVVLMPSGGLEPTVGITAARDFFWPTDSPPMTVTEFTMTPEEISGSRSLAYARETGVAAT